MGAVKGTPESVLAKQAARAVREKLATLVRTDFWFADGNIVLIAGIAAFKVHRGQLQRHSEVFHDLFSIPQPADQQLVDGCLWVELHDEPSDVYYFLMALYDGLYFAKPHANDFPSIAATLRLSSKYLVEHLRERCLLHLEADWPSTLAGWDLREERATDESGRYAPRESCAHPIPVIALALELGLDSLLPAAFYDLARYGPSKIVAGTHVPPPALVLTTTEHPPVLPHTALKLSHDLVCQTLLGREESQRFVAAFIQSELKSHPLSPACIHSPSSSDPTPTDPASPAASSVCMESTYFIHLNVLRAVGGIACGRDGDALFTLAQAGAMPARTDFSDGERTCGLRMCAPCKSAFGACVERTREEVWKRVPEWFGLRAPAAVKGDGDAVMEAAC